MEGCPKTTALHFLKADGVEVWERPGGMVRMVKGELRLSIDLPEMLCDNMLNALRKYFDASIPETAGIEVKEGAN